MHEGSLGRRLGVALVAAGVFGLGGAAQAAPPQPFFHTVGTQTVAKPTSWASVTPRRDAGTLRAEGFALLAAGDRAGAADKLAAAADEGSDDANLLRLLGDLRFHQQRKVDAVAAWTRALALRPADAGLLERNAHGAIEVGDYAAAAAAEARLVDLIEARVQGGAPLVGLLGSAHRPVAELFVHHLVRLSEAATLAGDFTVAERAARRCITFAPKRVEGHLALAYMHLQAAEYDDAAILYHEVLAVEPANAIALNNLGNVYYMDRDLDGASAHFEKVLEVEGISAHGQSLALANLGELLQLQGAYRDAEGLYREAALAQPEGAWSYMGLAALYDITGRYDAAIEAMIDGWERDGNRMTRLNMHFFQPEWAWQRDALIAEIEGDADLAAALWQRVVEGDVPALQKAAAHHLRSLDLAAE